MLYCEITLAVPVLLSAGSTSPTGRFWPFDTWVHDVPAFELIPNETFAYVMSVAPHGYLSLIVAVRVSVAVLLVALVVQKKREPV
jgi:hypothetical protein